MFVYLLAILTAVFINLTESQRTASLVILPPLVIGYDELYHDSGAEDAQGKAEKKPDNKEPVKDNLNLERNMKFDEPDGIVDVKGRRNYYRRLMGESGGNSSYLD